MIQRIDFSANGDIATAQTAPDPIPLVLQEFECPRCHSKTFGRFEPFVNRGIKRWCSACGYTETDNSELRRKYCQEHKQELWDNATEE